MNGQSYLLEIYDAEEFNGPNPLLVKGKGVVDGPDHTQYFMVEAMQTANHMASQLIRWQCGRTTVKTQLTELPEALRL